MPTLDETTFASLVEPHRRELHDVLRVEGGRIAEVTTFDATLFPAFGLAPVHPGAQRP